MWIWQEWRWIRKWLLTSTFLPCRTVVDVASLWNGDSSGNIDLGLLGQRRQQNSTETFWSSSQQSTNSATTSQRNLCLHIANSTQTRAQTSSCRPYRGLSTLTSTLSHQNQHKNHHCHKENDPISTLQAPHFSFKICFFTDPSLVIALWIPWTNITFFIYNSWREKGVHINTSGVVVALGYSTTHNHLPATQEQCLFYLWLLMSDLRECAMAQ